MQSNVARVGLGVLLVAAAVVLFIVLQDDDSSDEPGTTANQPAATGGGDKGSSEGGEPEKPKPPPIPEIVVRNGAPVGGVQEIDVTSGYLVRFGVSADEVGDVHVHGYDIERPVRAGKQVIVSFPADLEGGYEVEFHSHTVGDIPIAELVVNPG